MIFDRASAFNYGLRLKGSRNEITVYVIKLILKSITKVHRDTVKNKLKRFTSLNINLIYYVILILFKEMHTCMHTSRVHIILYIPVGYVQTRTADSV